MTNCNILKYFLSYKMRQHRAMTSRARGEEPDGPALCHFLRSCHIWEGYLPSDASVSLSVKWPQWQYLTNKDVMKIFHTMLDNTLNRRYLFFSNMAFTWISVFDVVVVSFLKWWSIYMLTLRKSEYLLKGIPNIQIMIWSLFLQRDCYLPAKYAFDSYFY